MDADKRFRRVRRVISFIFLITLALGWFGRARACEPCVNVLSLEETAARAELIVIGHGLDGITPPEFDGDFVGPDWITVEITQIILGHVEENHIRVNSWDGMCPYGIILHDARSYFMFLQEKGGIYDAVEYGCAIKTLPVIGSFVEYQGERLPIEEFINNLGINTQPITEIQVTPKTSFLLPVLLVLALGVLIIMAFWRWKRTDHN